MPHMTLAGIEAVLTSELHHGKPGLSLAKKRRLAESLASDKDVWIPQLAASSVPGARELALFLIGGSWAERPDWEGIVLRLSEDPDWEVREWASGAWLERYLFDPASAFPVYRRWAAHGSPWIKRALAVAVHGLASRADPAPLFEISDALAGEENPDVRKNLGPFALGDGLIPRARETAKEWLTRWSNSPSWAARWNAAASLTAARSRPQAEELKAMRARLREDEDSRVRRVAARAMKLAGL